MKYLKKLLGERIYLLPLNIEDAEKYAEWFCDFRVTDGVARSGQIMTVEKEKEWIENASKNGDLFFSIVKLENDELIGNCGLHDISYPNRIGTVGIFIGEEENRSHGYGAEALQLLVEYGFRYLNLNNIMLTVKSFNERAIHCYEKVGFQEFGRGEKVIF